MSIKASDIISLFNYAYNNKWGYVLGAVNTTWTKEKQSSTTNSNAKKYASKWIGHVVTDCSGLFVYAFKKLGGYIYHGSNTIWRKYTTDEKGKIGSVTIVPGMAVFKHKNDNAQPSAYKKDGLGNFYHIGLVVDNEGTVIEAKSTYYGVVKSKVSDWHYAARLKNVVYDEVKTESSEGSDNDNEYPKYGVINASPTLRFRKEGTTSSKVLKKIPNKTKIKLLSYCNGWYKAEYDGDTGYVMASYIQV